MTDCSQHIKDLLGESDMNKVAEMIGDLHYETLTQLFEKIANKIEWDSKNDHMNNRWQLSERLLTASHLIRTASIFIEDAWQISKPFMEDKH